MAAEFDRGGTAASLLKLARENQTLLDAAPVGIVYVRDRLIQRCNRRFEEIFGYGPQELIGRSTRMLYPDQDAFENAEERYAHLALGETHQREQVLLRRDGSSFWCRSHGRAMDPARRELGSVWLVEDVSQRKAEELAMRSLLMEQQAILDNAYTGIVFLRDLVVRRCNRRFAEMLGYTVEEVLDQHVTLFYKPDETYRPGTISYQQMSRGEAHTREQELRRRDGSLFWARLVGRALDPEHPEQDSVWLVDDVTEQRAAREELEQRVQRRKEVEEKLTAARDAAVAAQRAQTTFLSNVSHELRTPLNSILGYAQILLLDKSLGGQHVAGLKTVQSSGEHLLMLINDILDITKIETGNLELLSDPLHLASFLSVVGDLIKVKAAEKNLVFVPRIHGKLPETVQADERRLRQVLLNLLGNAVKFTDQGKVHLDVHVLDVDGARTRIRFEVRDTGIGIDEEHIQRLFQPFEQAGDASRRVTGSGLGLSISRQLVRLMGGDILVESTPNEGSLFWFEVSLPVLSMGARAAPAERTVIGYEGVPRSVLIVDDIAENREMLAYLLRSLKFQIDEAESGEAALVRARAKKPDLILMDMMMPGVDGLEATRLIRQDENLAQVPVIIISASVSREDQQKCVAVGANAFLAKPIKRETLLQQIGLLLDVAWICQQPDATAEDEPVSRSGTVLEELVALQSVPTHEELQTLHELALIGNMSDVSSEAERILAMNERYRPFVVRVQRLAKEYQAKALSALVKECVSWQTNRNQRS